jgi:catechol 2,3-dioxygenase-like lactoylglutathione lyase family enzyme
MKLNYLTHVSIIIKDAEESVNFYSMILKLPLVKVVKKPNQILRYFKISETQEIELNEYLYEVETYEGNLNDKGKYRHIAFNVDDIDEWQRYIESKGYPFHIPVSIDSYLNVKSGLFLDPNGVEIELVEKL